MKNNQIELILKMTGLPLEAIKTFLLQSSGLKESELRKLTLEEFREIMADLMQNILIAAKEKENSQHLEKKEFAKLIPFKKAPTS